MGPLTAKEALTYAVSREMVLVYLVILTGVLLQLVGTRFFAPVPYRVNALIGSVFGIVGFVATFVGSVALLYKLIVDGTAGT